MLNPQDETPPLCDEQDCTAVGGLRAPVAKRADGEIINGQFCKVHARVRNENWNFFSDMTEEEVENFHHESHSWHRKTYAQHLEGGSHAAGHGTEFLYEDTVLQGMFRAVQQPLPSLPDDVRAALKSLHFQHLPAEEELKAQFRKLVKKHHPDMHPSDKAKQHHAERLKVINAAHRLVKNYLAEIII